MYSDELLHVKNSRELEKILEQETQRLKDTVRDLILDKDLLCLLDIENLGETCLTCRIFDSPFLHDYMNYLVDMHNIKTFLRLYVLGQPQEILSQHLSCEGFIKREDFLEFYKQDIMAFLTRLEYIHTTGKIVDYAYYLGEAISKTIKEKSFAVLERAINDFLMQVLLPAKYMTFGPEPVFAYYFARRNEISLMRMIILAKLNSMPSGLVKTRLNKVYG
jgi:V/A-type H+-transporting ATPase subunit C